MVDTAEARQVCRAAGSLLYPTLDFDAKPNGTYPSEDFPRVLTRSAFEREFTNTSARHLQLARGDDLGVEFVMRAPQTPGIKRVLAEHDEERFVTDYELVRKGSPTMRVPVTLVVVPHHARDDDSLCLITNRLRSMDEAVPLAQAYRRRWGIETSYRKIGEFLPRTTSPVFAVRLFYFLFAVALYSLWIVVCLLLSEKRRVKTRPAVSTATFRFFLGPVTYG